MHFSVCDMKNQNNSKRLVVDPVKCV